MRKNKPKDAKPSLPPKVRKAILKVLEYAWDDEARHAEECLVDGEGGDHIFNSLVDLHNFVHGENRTPKSFLGPPW